MNQDDDETISILADLTHCPHCGENLVGEEIEPSRRELFGNRTHYSRLIGISNGDSIQYYECPKCRAHVDREPPTGGAFRTTNVEVRR